MASENVLRVFDWAPILLSLGSNLCCVGEDTVCVSAVGAIEFLESVEVWDKVTVNDDECRASDSRHSVETKTDGLVQRERQVQKSNGNHHRVDERSGKNVSGFRSILSSTKMCCFSHWIRRAKRATLSLNIRSTM